jgi:hypothetical protein
MFGRFGPHVCEVNDIRPSSLSDVQTSVKKLRILVRLSSWTSNIENDGMVPDVSPEIDFI